MSRAMTVAMMAILAGSVYSTARAQDYMGPSIDYVGNHIGASQFRRQIERGQVRPQPGDKSRSSKRSGSEPAPSGDGPAAPSATLRALAFTPSAATSAKVQSAMAEALAGRSAPAGLAATRLLEATFKAHPRFRALLAAQLGEDDARIRARLRSGALQSAFRRELTQYGYSPNNMGDVNNAYMIHAWGLVNNVRIDREAVFRGQRKKLERSIESGLQAPDLADAEKQEFCEVVGAVTMLTGTAWNAAAAGDRPVLQAGMRDIAKRMGLDLQVVKLSVDGFSG